MTPPRSSTSFRRVVEINRFVDGVEKKAFHAHEEKHWAVASQLLVIGEAVSRLSPTFRQSHPAIAWKRMSSMRNRLIHGYDKINWELVWRTATTEVPLLQFELKHFQQEP